MTQITVEITATRGSAPRDAGTVMVVSPTDITGTIGGGALEYRAIETARRLMAKDRPLLEETIPLGPDLGQCCGGAVSLRYSTAAHAPDAPQPTRFAPGLVPDRSLGDLWVWGAGHVGRAVIRQAAPLRAFNLCWIDSDMTRFPADIPDTVTPLAARDMPRLVTHAPRTAHHLIFTYSHDIDLALCSALLTHGFASCGLIGSQTKKTRFFKRLRAAGLTPERIDCPIGTPAQGKHPDAIAHSTLTVLLKTLQQRDDSAPDKKAVHP
ncbi:xanthine dehydrogenase accessory protein XdhC [Sulfitobacter sp. S190]|uniref:xanthine dehydrogenase accessory protein XdhC n=1 Tax=Sulfitobacter sp. S190 TaxID=2867022 RepID=UPI0021A8C6EB|nr:xanthine dehydrogenase accessory protein XdhC [Sulfitobacter sp. S190]UWR21781.1 xanthine dehydrogenase accessory protein XdhC [Sulfitobacter sp. S190]